MQLSYLRNSRIVFVNTEQHISIILRTVLIHVQLDTDYVKYSTIIILYLGSCVTATATIDNDYHNSVTLF